MKINGLIKQENMKLIKILLLLSFFLPSALFAKPHTGTFKFMHFTNAKNSFNTKIEVIYSLDTLYGEPVVKARAKYSIMGLVNVDGKRVNLPEKILDKLKIYNLKISVPFESKTVHRLLYIDIDMGAMGKRGEWSYNTPGSPNWNKWIRSEINRYGYALYGSNYNEFISKEEAIKAYKGFKRLGVSDNLGSLAEVASIKYNITAARQKKKEKPKETAQDLDDLFDNIEVIQKQQKQQKALKEKQRLAALRKKQKAVATKKKMETFKKRQKALKTIMNIEASGHVRSRFVTIKIIDFNSVQDDYYKLFLNGAFIGNVRNRPGATSVYKTKLEAGENLIELRLDKKMKKGTGLTIAIEPGGFSRKFKGSKNHGYSITAPH